MWTLWSSEMISRTRVCFFYLFVCCRGSGRVNLFFCGGISQKLVCMLCRLKRYNLIHHESRGEGVSSGFRWPCLWNMFSRKRQKDKLRPKRNLPLINSSAFTPNDHRPAAVCAAFLTLKWRFGLFVTFLLRGGSGLASNYMHKCHVLWFFEAKSSVFQHYRSVSWKLFRCVRCPIQLQELLTRRVS